MDDDIALATVRLGEREGGTADWAATLEQGTVVGRYVLLHRLGEGGMGVVYAAYDPELDRRVAVKMLRVESARDQEAARASLLREAQGMARVSHPNVVAVFDVGAVRDRVFLAMELVEGGSLRRWLRLERRGWREVLDMFVDVGRGLAAAHQAGLVHRDFKPDNVVVGKDGRGRVTDFGLVRRSDSTDGTVSETRPRDSIAPASVGTATYKGCLGTPGYMAPEQYLGETLGPNTDEFAFCAALYEGLYGLRPFAGSTLDELKESTCRGAVIAPPKDVGVPPWVFAVLRRGLATDPVARYPTIDALLNALDRRPRAARRQRVFLAVGATVATVGLALGWRTFAARTSPCEATAKRLVGIWDGQVHERLHRRFVASNLRDADIAFAATAAGLDRYTSEWVSAQKDACEATWVRGEQSAELLDARSTCLSTRLQEAKAIVAELEGAGRREVAAASFAVSALSGFEACTPSAVLDARVAKPAAGIAPAVEALRASLAEARALIHLGQKARAQTLAERALAEARNVHYAPAEAEALLALGSAFEGDDAAHAFEEATLVADGAGDDAVRAEALVMQVFTVGYELERPDDGVRLAAQAERVVARIHRRDLEALRLRKLSWVLGLKSSTLAIDAAERAYVLTKEVWPEDPRRLADALNSIANARYQKGEAATAEEAWRRALDVCTPRLPRTACAKYMNNLAIVYTDDGKTAEALAMAGRAVAATSSEEDAYEHVTALNALALAEALAGHYDASLSRAKEALAEAKDPVLRFEAQAAIGGARFGLGQMEEAHAMLGEALGLLEAEHLALPAEAGSVRFQLAEAAWALGRTAEALTAARRAESELATVPTQQRKLELVRGWLRERSRG